MATAQEMQFRVELNEPLVTQTMLGVLQQGDAKANVIRIAVYDGGMHTPAALEGTEVSGYFLREDGERVLLEGSISGNVVSVVLNENCYAISGSYGAFVRLANTQNGAKRTILRIAGQVESEGGGPIIDPANRIPSIDDVIAQLAKMEEAIEKAENAANNVGDAAEKAQSAATTANNAASTANEAAGNANTAATNANNATARANTAAAALENAPVPAGTVVTYQAGTSATVPPSGEWLADVPTVPQGQFLWTRTVQSFTNGDPVTSYSVARQGVDGTGSVSSVNGIGPDASGNVTIEAGGGTVQSVNGVSPDEETGNITLTASDVGAVAENKIVNNFTTTEEGYVADAMALKALNDKISSGLKTFAFRASTAITFKFSKTMYGGMAVFIRSASQSALKLYAVANTNITEVNMGDDVSTPTVALDSTNKTITLTGDSSTHAGIVLYGGLNDDYVEHTISAI